MRHLCEASMHVCEAYFQGSRHYNDGHKKHFVHKVDWSSGLKTKTKLLYSIPKQKILDSSQLKEFADDNFKFDENGSKFSNRVENTT